MFERDVECFYGDHDYGSLWSPNCRNCGYVNTGLLAYLGRRGKYAKKYGVRPEVVEHWWTAAALKEEIGPDFTVESAIEALGEPPKLDATLAEAASTGA